MAETYVNPDNVIIIDMSDEAAQVYAQQANVSANNAAQSEAAAANSATAAATSAEEAAASAEASANSATASAESASAASTSETNAAASAESIADSAAQINLNTQRINNLAQAITPGSTSADAELIDIRTGEDGTVYQNAGTAVRTQVSALKDALNANGVVNYPYENVFSDPFFLNTDNTTPGKVDFIEDDNGKILHLTNSGSAPITYYALNKRLLSGNTIYIKFQLKGSAENLPFRIRGQIGSTQYTLYDFITHTQWTEESVSVVMPDDAETVNLVLRNVGECYVRHLIISENPIDYDFSVKDTVKKIIPVVNEHDEILNGNVSLEQLSNDLRAVYFYKYSALSLAFESGYMTTAGTIDTSTAYHAEIPVLTGEKYSLTSQHGGDCKMYVLINSNDEAIGYYPTERVSTRTETVEITIPADGTLCLNTFARSQTGAKKVVGIGVDAGGSITEKTWYALGDSITEFAEGYHAIIAEETGAMVTNGGVSGSGYMKPINNKTFVDRANLSEVYDIVTVFGSVNDMQYVSEHLGTESDTGTETLGGCFNSVIDNLYASGNYHIGIISPIPNDSTGGNPANSTGSFAQYTELLEKVCKRRGVPFLNLWRCSNMQPWDATFAETYMQDNTHPNADGHAIFAPRIKAFIESL